MKELHFTPVFEDIRAALDVSRDEYALCNYIQIWGSFPKAKYRGYCDRTQQEMATFVGITRMGLRKMLTRLTGRGLLVFCPSIHLYEVSDIWFDAVNTRSKSKQSLPIDEVNKVDESKQSLQAEVNKVDFAPIYSNKNSNKREGVTPNGEPSPPASEFQLARNPSEVETPTSKPKGQETKQTEQRAVSTLVIPTELQTPAFAEVWGEWMEQPKQKKKPQSAHLSTLNRLAKYPPAFAMTLVELAVQGNYQGCIFQDTPQAFERWKKAEQQQPQHTPPTPAEIGTAKRNAHLEELQKRGLRRPTPQQ